MPTGCIRFRGNRGYKRPRCNREEARVGGAELSAGSERHYRRSKRGLKAKGTKVCPHVLYARVAYSHSVIDGRTALEFEPDGKAAEEVRMLFRWSCGQVHMPACQRVAA